MFQPQDKPFSFPVTAKLAKSRSTGEREGWVFHNADVTKPRWSMTDKITYRLPDHTEEDPDLRTETLRSCLVEVLFKGLALRQ